jgi:peptidoglycan hydrolase-like protein with peptidoglycan-binding domain
VLLRRKRASASSAAPLFLHIPRAGTEKAVREYQHKNGLAADGAAGPVTLAHMRLFPEVTQETVKASQVPASSIPDIAGAAASVAAGTAAGVRSIWDTIKSVFK